jgi:hypothetical protein
LTLLVSPISLVEFAGITACSPIRRRTDCAALIPPAPCFLAPSVAIGKRARAESIGHPMTATALRATAATARIATRPCGHSDADLSEHFYAEIPPILRNLIPLNSIEHADRLRVGTDLLSPDTRYTGPRRGPGISAWRLNGTARTS